jgi:hypothetical protein
MRQVSKNTTSSPIVMLQTTGFPIGPSPTDRDDRGSTQVILDLLSEPSIFFRSSRGGRKATATSGSGSLADLT